MFQHFTSTLFIKLVNVISLHFAAFPNFQTKGGSCVSGVTKTKGSQQHCLQKYSG